VHGILVILDLKKNFALKKMIEVEKSRTAASKREAEEKQKLMKELLAASQELETKKATDSFSTPQHKRRRLSAATTVSGPAPQ